MEVAIPGEDDIQSLNDLIFGPLASGQKTPAMKEELGAVVRRMAATAKLDALVVACTDLMDLLEPSLPLLDPIDSHVRVAAERLLEPGAARGHQRSDLGSELADGMAQLVPCSLATSAQYARP